MLRARGRRYRPHQSPGLRSYHAADAPDHAHSPRNQRKVPAETRPGPGPTHARLQVHKVSFRSRRQGGMQMDASRHAVAAAPNPTHPTRTDVGRSSSFSIRKACANRSPPGAGARPRARTPKHRGARDRRRIGASGRSAAVLAEKLDRAWAAAADFGRAKPPKFRRIRRENKGFSLAALHRSKALRYGPARCRASTRIEKILRSHCARGDTEFLRV